VGLLHALYARSGRDPSAHELATAACEIELERVAAPIGKQDQFAAAYGGMNFIQFHPDGGVKCIRLNVRLKPGTNSRGG
jgi:D-glycero-alpha-D-manno-heptose-7-phosphate kinase